MRYVALGDSYTIGTSVAESERWPNQLVERVERLELVANPAVNGYTSLDLINDELPQLEAARPDLVSVLIGVNDVVQGVPEAQYAGNLAVILEELLTRLPADRIVCIATPDYTVTPSGGAFGDPSQQSDAILRANATMARGVQGARDPVRAGDLRDQPGGAGRPVARGGRRPPPVGRAVSPLGRRDRAGGGGPDRLLSAEPSAPASVMRPSAPSAFSGTMSSVVLVASRASRCSSIRQSASWSGRSSASHADRASR